MAQLWQHRIRVQLRLSMCMVHIAYTPEGLNTTKDGLYLANKHIGVTKPKSQRFALTFRHRP